MLAGVLLERSTQRFMNGARRGDDQVAVVISDRGRPAGFAPDFRTDGFTDHGYERFGAFRLGGDLFLLGLATASAAEQAAPATPTAACRPTVPAAAPRPPQLSRWR